MSTKYAQARDVAYQWRAEFRKVRQENRSLRRVYEDARALAELDPTDDDPVSRALHIVRLSKLRESLKRAVFAVPQEP